MGCAHPSCKQICEYQRSLTPLASTDSFLKKKIDPNVHICLIVIHVLIIFQSHQWLIPKINFSTYWSLGYIWQHFPTSIVVVNLYELKHRSRSSNFLKRCLELSIATMRNENWCQVDKLYVCGFVPSHLIPNKTHHSIHCTNIG